MTGADSTIEYAGLWRRFVACMIDVTVVGVAMSTIVLLSALTFPGLQSLLTLDSPFAMFTVERTLDGQVVAGHDGTPGTIEKTIDRTVWGRWTYRYRVTEKVREVPDLRGPANADAEWQQIDPATGKDLDAVGVSEVVWLALLFYWPLMESSRLQASFGKWAVAIKVTGLDGRRLSLQRSVARNVLKIVSAVPLMLGFVTALFSKRKQTLHDLLSRAVLPLSV